MGKLKNKRARDSDGYFLIDTAVSAILILVMIAGISGFLISASWSLQKITGETGKLLTSGNIIYGKTYDEHSR